MNRAVFLVIVLFSVVALISIGCDGDAPEEEAGISGGEGVTLSEGGDVNQFTGALFAPSELLVKFEKNVDRDHSYGLIRTLNTSVLSRSERSGLHKLRILDSRPVGEVINEFLENPEVEYAEPNFKRIALFVPNDPYYLYQWHLDNDGYGGIHMEAAWDQSDGTGAVVAVVDTGVAYETYRSGRDKFYLAPDLADTTFVPGYDFAYDDAHPNDDQGHGTHVTGTIAQSTDNGLGVAGVAFGASIMPIKVLDKTGSGYDSDVADGIYWATDNGANVINLSLGGPGYSTTLENAVAYAYNHGVTVVAAAGNEYEDGNPTSYPAAYDAYCIAVAGTTYNEQHAFYSNTGSYVDIAAPGGDLNADLNGDGYTDGILQQTFSGNTSAFGFYFYQGTSMATPHVAGVAALLVSSGTVSPDAIREAIENTAEDKGVAGWDEVFGHGVVNASAALNYSAAPTHDVAVTSVSAPSTILTGDIVDVTVDAANLGDFAETFDVTLIDTTDGLVIGTRTVSLGSGASTSLTFGWDTQVASVGVHVLEAEAGVVSGEANLDNNAASASSNIVAPVHDVAVIAVDVTAEATQGEQVTIPVTVENLGTYAENTTVTLVDTTDGVTIGSAPVSLNLGEQDTVTFTWDTSGASLGSHYLAATIAAVPGETDLADNSIDALTTVIEQPADPALHVSSIDLSLTVKKTVNATASVMVVDADGAGIVGATVYGHWSGLTSDTDAIRTAPGGIATIKSDKVPSSLSGAFTFTVDDVANDGYLYDASANVETSDSVNYQ